MSGIVDSLKGINKENWKKVLVQFIKFGIVGVSNTLISYSIDMLCYYVLFRGSNFNTIVQLFAAINITVKVKTVRTVFATILAFVISVTNSYYWNNRYVFKSAKKTSKEHAKAYVKTFLSYGITGLILSPIIKILLTNFGISYAIAGLASLVITIPLNFVMNKFWAFKA